MISIIMPTLNEANNLEILFRRIAKLKLRNYEIIVADSNSKDNTIGMAKNLASRKKWPIKAIQTGNTDLSNAIIKALPKAKGDIVAVIDADLQHPPELLPKMFDLLKKGNDIVIASRFAKGAKTELNLRRICISRVYITLSHIFVPKTKTIKDPASGYFAFKKKILKNVRLEPIGFKILLEILAKANYSNDKVLEIPFTFGLRARGKSKFNLKQSFIAFKHLLKLATYSKEHHRLLKFLAIGATGIVINEGLLWLLTESGLFYLFSSLIAIETSIISNFIFNDLWTFKKERKGKFFTRFGKFNLVRLATLAINFIVLWVLTSLGLYYLLSNLVGIAIATTIGYLASLWWVWK
ncbi:MAG: glycosyltransferase [Candidatus Pacearchaeota archaeon]|nr:glycosyltransferase [Candidatus Pacearchaeota archaeon]